jgi:hypothetical protein
MSHRTVISVAVAAILGLAFMSNDAQAYRGGGVRGVHGGGVAYRGGYRGGAVAWRGGGYRGAAVVGRGGYRYGGGYYRPGWGAAAVGAAAIGTAAASSYYYNRPACGYYPYPPCY